jgi:hypothetical protein
MPLTTFSYNPRQMYWLADDGRIFSGPSEQIVDATDQGYIDYTDPTLSNSVSVWPRDASGNQTDATMQAVLDAWGMFVNLNYYTVYVRWMVEQGGMTLSSGMLIETNDRSQAKINGVRGNALADSSFTTQWWAADFTIWTLDATQIAAMSSELQTFINNNFTTSANTLTSIQNGTITTRAEVDSAFGFTPAKKAGKWPGPSFPKELKHS